VATHGLDELLARRELLVDALAPALRAKAGAVGVELVDVGVRDLVLPGEMKTLLNRVIEAQKEAEANVIMRREETAATRSLAQTAKVLAENPLLVRLKELEAYKELAQKVGTVHVVMGDTGLSKIELKT
jgi:regulator of protease activity HflC (stomatin/prohibitin superfamily)